MTIKKQQRERMLEYIVTKLRGNNEDVIPRIHKFAPGENSRIIYVGNDGIVLLSDKMFTEEQFSSMWNSIKQSGYKRFANIFYKDHDTYFKSNAARSNFRVNRDRSMKGYSTSDLQDLIILKPAELIAKDRWENEVQYYQEGPKLTEGIVTYKYEPVTFDYSHIHPDERFGPEQRESTKRFLNEKIEEAFGDLKLDGSYIRAK